MRHVINPGNSSDSEMTKREALEFLGWNVVGFFSLFTGIVAANDALSEAKEDALYGEVFEDIQIQDGDLVTEYLEEPSVESEDGEIPAEIVGTEVFLYEDPSGEQSALLSKETFEAEAGESFEIDLSGEPDYVQIKAGLDAEGCKTEPVSVTVPIKYDEGSPHLPEDAPYDLNPTHEWKSDYPFCTGDLQ